MSVLLGLFLGLVILGLEHVGMGDEVNQSDVGYFLRDKHPISKSIQKTLG